MAVGGGCEAEASIFGGSGSMVAIGASKAEAIAVATADSPLSHMVGLLFTTLLTTLLHG